MEKATDLHALIKEIECCEKLTPKTKIFLYKLIATNYVASQIHGVFNEFTDKFSEYCGKLEKELQYRQS